MSDVDKEIEVLLNELTSEQLVKVLNIAMSLQAAEKLKGRKKL